MTKITESLKQILICLIWTHCKVNTGSRLDTSCQKHANLQKQGMYQEPGSVECRHQDPNFPMQSPAQNSKTKTCAVLLSLVGTSTKSACEGTNLSGRRCSRNHCNQRRWCFVLVLACDWPLYTIHYIHTYIHMKPVTVTKPTIVYIIDIFIILYIYLCTVHCRYFVAVWPS